MVSVMRGNAAGFIRRVVATHGMGRRPGFSFGVRCCIRALFGVSGLTDEEEEKESKAAG